MIVHGGWGGGWEWTAVARALRERGHDVFTPTLTGMGERAHLGGPGVGLATHVEDVIAVLELEDLHDVVLCGHSYGGMPVSGAADLAAERITLVIYIDALVPSDGQSAFDLLPDEFAELARASAVDHGDGWRVTIPPSLLPPPGWTAEDERARYIARLRVQPLASFAGGEFSGAADLAAERITLVIYIDALVPSDGQSAFVRLGTVHADIVSRPDCVVLESATYWKRR